MRRTTVKALIRVEHKRHKVNKHEIMLKNTGHELTYALSDEKIRHENELRKLYDKLHKAEG